MENVKSFNGYRMHMEFLLKAWEYPQGFKKDDLQQIENNAEEYRLLHNITKDQADRIRKDVFKLF